MLGGAREWKRVSELGVSGMRSLCSIRRSSIDAAGESGGISLVPSAPRRSFHSPMRVIKSSTSQCSKAEGTSRTPSPATTVLTMMGPSARLTGSFLTA